MLHKPLYHPAKTFDENIAHGPYGIFANKRTYTNVGQPGYGIFGRKIFSPFGIAAGPLFTSHYIAAALRKGFDIVTYKTVRSGIFPCNPWPNLVAIQTKEITPRQRKIGVLADMHFIEPLSAANSYGVPSFDPNIWQPDIKKSLQMIGKGQLLIVSFQGTVNEQSTEDSYIADFVKTAKLARKAGAPILEVNTSCPNEGNKHLLCFDITRMQKIIDAIKNEIGDTPLIVKLAYFDNKDDLKKLIKLIGSMVEGIEVINTVMTKLVDKKRNPMLGDNRTMAGVMGHAILPMGLEMVKSLYQLRQELGYSYRIFGVGGVTKAEDFLKYRKAGADVVMSATGAMWYPYLAQDIKKKLL